MGIYRAGLEYDKVHIAGMTHDASLFAGMQYLMATAPTPVGPPAGAVQYGMWTTFDTDSATLVSGGWRLDFGGLWTSIILNGTLDDPGSGSILYGRIGDSGPVLRLGTYRTYQKLSNNRTRLLINGDVFDLYEGNERGFPPGYSDGDMRTLTLWVVYAIGNLLYTRTNNVRSELAIPANGWTISYNGNTNIQIGGDHRNQARLSFLVDVDGTVIRMGVPDNLFAAAGTDNVVYTIFTYRNINPFNLANDATLPGSTLKIGT